MSNILRIAEDLSTVVQQGHFCFVGTGSSTGVPMVGCTCSVCSSKNPKNIRLRSGAWIRIGETNILIDATPDFRQQALRHTIPMPDTLLITHTHFDHIGGLEELRTYNIHLSRPIRCIVSNSSYDDIKKLFYYHFETQRETKSFSAQFDFHVIPATPTQLLIQDIPVSTFSYSQGSMSVTGYRIGSLAYVTDIKEYSPSIFEHLTNLDTLVVSAVWLRPSRMQLALEEAVAFQQKVGAKKTYLTHLSHEIDYETVRASLPSNVDLAYDGLQFDFAV